MKSRKVMSALIIALLALSMLVHSVSAEDFKIDPTEVTVAAGSIGGSWYLVCTAMFDVFSRNIEGLRFSVIPGGGLSNPITLNQKEAEFGILYTTNLWAAYHGEEPYEEPITDLRGIARLGTQSVLHNFVRTGAGINSIKELAESQQGIRLDAGTRGLAGELHVERMLNMHGVSYADIRSWGGSVIHSSYSEASNRLIDGHIDAFFNNDVIGQPLWVELATAANVVLLPQEEEAVEKMVDNYGYSRHIIPAGSYRGQDEDVLTTSQDAVFVCHKDTPEELVYMITKLIFERQDRLIAAYGELKNINIETAIPENAPLHPGAERYYREIGAIE